MNLETKFLNGVLMLTLQSARLDAANADAFRSRMESYIREGHSHFILDLSQVTFMDSGGLGTLIYCLKLIGKTGRLVLCNVPAPVLSLFKLTRMNEVFETFPDGQSAIEAMQP